jgi:hypothetical protein
MSLSVVIVIISEEEPGLSDVSPCIFRGNNAET